MGDSSLEGRRILVVEDEYLLAVELRRELRKAGVRVLGPVPSIDMALDVLDVTPDIDAVLLDVSLQGEMSYPVADMLVERGVPFVFATGFAGNSVLDRNYPHVPRCEKPFEIHMIEDALDSVMHVR